MEIETSIMCKANLKLALLWIHRYCRAIYLALFVCQDIN